MGFDPDIAEKKPSNGGDESEDEDEPRKAQAPLLLAASTGNEKILEKLIKHYDSKKAAATAGKKTNLNKLIKQHDSEEEGRNMNPYNVCTIHTEENILHLILKGGPYSTIEKARN